MECNKCLEESLCRHIGQTVTIFTTSGGISGAGFTGVLAHVGNGCINLITRIGAAPACPISSECGGPWGRERREERREERCKDRCEGLRRHDRHRDRCCGREKEKEFEEIVPLHGRNWLGSVTVIPLCSIASFVHHAI